MRLHLFLIVILDAANAGVQASWQANNFLSHWESAIKQSAGDDGAEASQAEHAVNRQARPVVICFNRCIRKNLLQRLHEFLQTSAGLSRNSNQGGIAQTGSMHQLTYFQFHQLQPFRVIDQIDFSNNNDPLLNLKQIKDG